jgi:hypothetical protein
MAVCRMQQWTVLCGTSFAASELISRAFPLPAPLEFPDIVPIELAGALLDAARAAPDYITRRGTHDLLARAHQDSSTHHIVPGPQPVPDVSVAPHWRRQPDAERIQATPLIADQSISINSWKLTLHSWHEFTGMVQRAMPAACSLASSSLMRAWAAASSARMSTTGGCQLPMLAGWACEASPLVPWVRPPWRQRRRGAWTS